MQSCRLYSLRIRLGFYICGFRRSLTLYDVVQSVMHATQFHHRDGFCPAYVALGTDAKSALASIESNLHITFSAEGKWCGPASLYYLLRLICGYVHRFGPRNRAALSRDAWGPALARIRQGPTAEALSNITFVSISSFCNGPTFQSAAQVAQLRLIEGVACQMHRPACCCMWSGPTPRGSLYARHFALPL